jgi:diaminobutyrate-2-oxoglutarate transaminase
LLSDPQFSDLFDVDELRLIAVHIPWTRIVEPVRTTGPDAETIDLADYIVKHRERLVLKHRGLTRGEEVHIGPVTTQQLWEEVCARALPTRSYIVQDYVHVPRREFITPATGDLATMWYELDPYLFDGEFAGFQCRASLDAVVNVAKNGMMVPVIVTDGQQV